MAKKCSTCSKSTGENQRNRQHAHRPPAERLISMSEFIHQNKLAFSNYLDFVRASRFSSEAKVSWRNDYVECIEGELIEFLTQHGHGSLLLLPKEVSIEYKDVPTGIRFGMADEMGDSVWFGFDIAERAGLDVGKVTSRALENHTSQHIPDVADFAQLERLSLEYADKIKVINKAGLYGIGETHTSLSGHPNYLLLRTGMRLSRSLSNGGRDLAPFTATEMEPIVGVERSLGDYLLVLAYVAKARLGISIEDIARFNMAKLEHRRKHGKENDIQFEQRWIS